MTNQIQFELVSPEEKLVSEPVHMAVIPGAEGEFGVMAGHSALVAELKAGVVELYAKDSKDARKIFIAGGFADVTGEQCIVLAEEAVNVNDLNKGDLEKQLKILDQDLGLAEEAADKARIKKRIKLTQQKLDALS